MNVEKEIPAEELQAGMLVRCEFQTKSGVGGTGLYLIRAFLVEPSANREWADGLLQTQGRWTSKRTRGGIGLMENDLLDDMSTLEKQPLLVLQRMDHTSNVERVVILYNEKQYFFYTRGVTFFLLSDTSSNSK